MKKVFRLFYHKKLQNDKVVVRVLFFRYKRDRKDNEWKDFTISLSAPKCKKVGRMTYCASNPDIASPDTEIGAFCSLGNNIRLGHGVHPLSYLSTSPYLYLDPLRYKSPDIPSHNDYLFGEITPIKIGNDVWIGDNVCIKNGVTVGDGAVIGMGSVVTKDVPPYAIVAGVPARVIRYRFDENTISRLLKTKWWTRPDDVIRKLPYDNVQESLRVLEML